MIDEIQITFTNAPAETENPADAYVSKMLAESENPEWLDRWHVLPDGANKHPRYQYINSKGVSTVLTCEEKTDEHVHYSMRCRKHGKQLMLCGQWCLAQEYNALGILYERIAQYVHRKNSPQVSPQQTKDITAFFHLIGILDDETP